MGDGDNGGDSVNGPDVLENALYGNVKEGTGEAEIDYLEQVIILLACGIWEERMI